MIQLLSILVIGLGIGWLAGLSVSPVIATVLASLVGVAGGLVAGVRSLPRESAESPTRAASPLQHVDARPAALLVLGIGLGAPSGIMMRTHGVLEPPAARPAGADTQAPARERLGVLFGITVEQCESLRAMSEFPNERAYRDVVAGSGEWGRLLETEITDTAKLKEIVAAICREDGA